jgi:hypothetical protein
MLRARQFALLALSAGWVGVAALAAASPAAADVDCSDLKTRDAAQTYFDGRTGDPDRLDTDADGNACEGNDPTTPGTWPLIALGVLLAGGLVRYSTMEKGRKRQHAEAELPGEPVLEPVAVSAPVILQQAVEASFAPPGQQREVLASAKTGSVGELARALRMVPYAERMRLLEAHAEAHGSKPQDVLNALAEHTTDLELQGWALAGYDPPWTVRVMRCSCVDGMRNFRLQTADDGSHYWACASCHTSDRHPS